MTYSSIPDTERHIDQVRSLIAEVITDLSLRALRHDASKLEEPELSTFDEFTPKLAQSTYGSDDYQSLLEAMAPALRHHYEANDHHPEHFPSGVADMDLIQVTEMLCDWKAATMRHDDGDLARSISHNVVRFGYGPDIKALLTKTAERMGWL